MRSFLSMAALAVAVIACSGGVYGMEHIERRDIILGDDVHDGKFPFFAFSTGDGTQGCGATLIHKDILLSAAHCQDVFKGEGKSAYVGATFLSENLQDLHGDDKDGKEHNVADVLVHDRYTEYNLNNDIMLIKLETPSDVRPVVWNTKPWLPEAGMKVDAIGFGYLELEHNVLSQDLQMVQLDIVGHESCQKKYTDVTFINDEKEICAHDVTVDDNGDRSAVCKGDSGGPLLKGNKQVGIVSFGKECASDYPGVFVRLSYYDQWIQEGICQLSSHPPPSCGDRNPGESVTIDSFIAINTDDKATKPTPQQVDDVIENVLNTLKVCYWEATGERLFDIVAKITGAEYNDGNPAYDDAMGIKRPTLCNAGYNCDYNIYLEFDSMEVIFLEGGTPMRPSVLGDIFSQCVDGEKGYGKEIIVYDIRKAGGVFQETTEVLFKYPIGIDQVD